MVQEDISSWFREISAKVVNESTLSFGRARRALKCFVLSKILFRKFAPQADWGKFQDELEQVSRIAA